MLIALAHAARRPERVSCAVVFGGGARGWDMMSEQGTQALLSLIERDWDTFVESVAHAWLGWRAGEDGSRAADWFRGSTTPSIALATIREASAVDLTPDLARIRCPVLVLHRASGPVIPRAVSEGLAAAIPDGRLRVLPGATAGLFTEGGAEAVDAITSFVTADGSLATSRRLRDALARGVRMALLVSRRARSRCCACWRRVRPTRASAVRSG